MRRPTTGGFYRPKNEERGGDIRIERKEGRIKIEFTSLSRQSRVVFAEYARSGLQLSNPEGNEYFGYLYITGKKPNESNPKEFDEYDFGPFKFSWGMKTQLAIQINFGDGVSLRPYGPDPENKLKDSARTQRMIITGYTLTNYEIEDELGEIDEEDYEEKPAAEIVEPITETSSVDQPKNDTEVKSPKGKVRKKTHINKNAIRREKLIKRSSEVKRKTIEEKLHKLEIYASEYLKELNFGKSKAEDKFNAISRIIEDLSNYKGEDKNLVRVVLKSGKSKMMNWLLSMLQYNLSIGSNNYELSRERRLKHESLANELQTYIPKDILNGNKLITRGSLNIPSTNRSFRHYISSLFWMMDDNQEKVEKILRDSKTILDMGAGGSLSTNESFLDLVKDSNPNCKTMALDIIYAQTADKPSPELMASCGSKVDVNDVVRKGRENGHILISESAQNMQSVDDESVDLIVSFWVFDKFNEEKDGAMQALREVIRVSKPNAEIRLAPVNNSEKLQKFLKDYSDCFEVQTIKPFEEQEITWNNGMKTVYLSLKRKPISKERLEEIKRISQEWILN